MPRTYARPVRPFSPSFFTLFGAGAANAGGMRRGACARVLERRSVDTLQRPGTNERARVYSVRETCAGAPADCFAPNFPDVCEPSALADQIHSFVVYAMQSFVCKCSHKRITFFNIILHVFVTIQHVHVVTMYPFFFGGERKTSKSEFGFRHDNTVVPRFGALPLARWYVRGHA